MGDKQVYRIQGLSCTNCAAKFENNVKQISGVEDAKINFGAAKITVIGEASISEIEQAGSFDKLKVVKENERIEVDKTPFFLKHFKVIIAFLFVVAGWILFFSIGEEHIATKLLFATSIVIGGYRLFITGLKNLTRLQFDMKTLMTIAIIGAAIIGEWAEGATVVILFAISEALETYSMEKARASIRSLMNIAPKEAKIKRASEIINIPVEDISVGDIMVVKPGEKLAMDGEIVSGISTLSEAEITGESIPVEKHVGDSVFAGTFNESGYLEVKVTKRVEDTTIAKIIHLVEEAQAERAPSQAFVDKFAKYYTPAIMMIALLVAIVPPIFFSLSWEAWIYQGLAVLVVGCPCALVVSTPVAIVTAIGNAARNGVLIKGGVHLEEVGAIRAIAFDKTGTLTKGVPVVTDILPIHGSKEDILRKVAAIESASNHPLANALVAKVEEDKIDFSAVQVTDFNSITGKGIMGTIDNETYMIGSPNWFREMNHPHTNKFIEEINTLQSSGKTVMVVGKKDIIVSIIALRDEVRTVSKSVIEKLHHLGIQQTVMLTGDNKQTGEAIGKEVEVGSVHSELLPEQKLTFIKELRKKYGSVAMVGDGVNDTPALAAANIGIAMGGAGTDTALETSDIALMGDDLQKLPLLIRLSRKTLTIIKQNISFSLGLKLLALLLVIPGWLTLWIAILADMGATLLVTLNSLRLLKTKE